MISMSKGISFAMLLTAGFLIAQKPGAQRKIVKEADLSVPNREAVIATVELAAGASAGRHTHPGEEVTYVHDGEGELMVEGRPPLTLKPGVGFVVPAGAKHDAKNTGSQPLHLVVIYVVEKGKPLATPAP
jgi:quercetin dioxygenase-like cupin family protein